MDEQQQNISGKAQSLPERLSGQYRESFAYATISARLPVILTKVIDTVYKYRKQAVELHGQGGADDCKAIVGRLSELKNRMQTDKPLLELSDERPDTKLWNQYLASETERCNGVPPSWFKSAWLYVECYLYRAINEAVALRVLHKHLPKYLGQVNVGFRREHWERNKKFSSTCLKTFDPFEAQKQTALNASKEAMVILTSYVDEVVTDGNASFDKFAEFVQFSLWGNKCDLSISAGVENSQKLSPLSQLATMQANILVNNIHGMWQTLCTARETAQATPGRRVRLDVVLDNAGFELFSDLVFVDYLLRVKLIDVVYFHIKLMPWFVSDVVKHDWDWTLKTLQEIDEGTVSSLSRRFQERLASGVCVLQDHMFWTTFHEFSSMKEVAPDLYGELSNADVVVLKGDLNYRKLVADRYWPYTTPFEEALCGFHPAPLCALRTLKADVVVGLREGMEDEKRAQSKDWMVSGENAVIQFCSKVVQL